MGNVLLVPIRVDALWLQNDLSVLEAMADFSRLPYVGNQSDVNATVANISEEILSQPFQDRGLQLRAGIHLHWALPDALTQGHRLARRPDEDPAKPDVVDFLPVPDRWLVRRTDGNGAKAYWIVESDYLYPEDPLLHPEDPLKPGHVSYPIHPSKNAHQPYRHIGRKAPLEHWADLLHSQAGYLNKRTASNRDHKLTAVGYGDPNFAAFYPNCLNVFGFHDPNYATAPPKGVIYDIIGWHDDPADDCLQSEVWQRAWKKIDKKYAEVTPPPSALAKKLEALTQEFNWKLPDTTPDFPDRIVCYGQLTFPADPVSGSDRPPTFNGNITIGNTGTEALSVYLADQLGGPEKTKFEERLEALHLAPQIEHRQIDVGFKFQEARHNKGFRSIPGGSLWAVRPRTKQKTADVQTAPTQMTLPSELAHHLNQLNLRQQDYDRALVEAESRRKQIFADWYKYMVSAYPPADSLENYPDMAEIRDFIERDGLTPFKIHALHLQDKDKALTAAWNTMYEGVIKLQLLRVEEILDWPKFQQAFQAPKLETYISSILAKIPATTQALLKQQLTDAQKSAVVADLNSTLTQSDFYNETTFAQVTLSPEAQDLLKNKAGWSLEQSLRFNRLALEVCFPESIARAPIYVLQQIAAPRYWQPTDPVVLLAAGPDFKPTPRHGEDGTLTCEVINVTLPTQPVAEINAFETILQNISFSKSSLAWKANPWHPFLLEWQVELLPAKHGSNLVTPQRCYQDSFIKTNYHLLPDQVDLTQRLGDLTTVSSATIYSGRSILTPHASVQLQKKIAAYLKANQGSTDENIPLLQQVLNDYLNSNEHYFLSQSLGGFNEALLMHKQTLQLPVNDPLGFDKAQAFTQAVAKVVGRSNRSAPQPQNAFCPLRTGQLQFLNLRLVDTFGRVCEIITEGHKPGASGPLKIIASESMQAPNDPGRINLPPRLSQPARLNFRWLAADHGWAASPPARGDVASHKAVQDDLEMNAHPATTPICGWLAPNNLDNTLMVYNGAGQALGQIMAVAEASDPNKARWLAEPGSRAAVYNPINIANPHLRQVVRYLREQGKEFITDFLLTLDSALETIDPANFAQHEALALLMGRPIAVVRAAINLELQGLAAINQAWTIFRQDMAQAEVQPGSSRRTHDDFTQVKFPIRIGEYAQLNDGLVGYWKEVPRQQGGYDYEADIFYAPQSNEKLKALNTRRILTYEQGLVHLSQALADPVQKLTMLLDPRGAVHASSGILPAKALTIPPDQYVQALQAIEVTFLSSPIITDRSQLNLPLPTEPGYQWSWVTKARGGATWQEVAPDQIKPAKPDATFGHPQRIVEGWLKLSKREES